VSWADYDCHLMLDMLSVLENSLMISHTLRCLDWNNYHRYINNICIQNNYNQYTDISVVNQGQHKEK